MRNFLKFSIHRIFAHQNGLFTGQTSVKKNFYQICSKNICLFNNFWQKSDSLHEKFQYQHTTRPRKYKIYLPTFPLTVFLSVESGFLRQLLIVSGGFRQTRAKEDYIRVYLSAERRQGQGINTDAETLNQNSQKNHKMNDLSK